MERVEKAKKPLSLACAAALVVSLCLPTAALAEVGEAQSAEQMQGETAAQPADESAVTDDGIAVQDADAAPAVAGVAQIGDKEYATLQEAIDAAKSGDTIVLLGDVVVDKLTVIDKDMTIDLGGHKLSRSGSVLDIYSNVVIRNGDIAVENATGTGAVWVNKQASLVVEKDVSITVPDSCFGVSFDGSCDGAKIAFSGTIKGGNGITINGTIKTANQLTVDGANIEVAGHGIYQAGTASTSFTVSNTTINAGCTGIEVRAGNLTVENCTIKGGSVFECKANGSGTTTDGAGIAIAQHTTKQPIDVQVKGGSISGKYAIYESNPQGNSPEDIAKVKLSVSDGTLNGSIHSEDLTGFISGGTFSERPDTAYVADGYVAVENDGVFNILKKTATKVDKEGKTEGFAAVVSSALEPELSQNSAEALAGVAADAAKSMKEDKKVPTGVVDEDGALAALLNNSVAQDDAVSVTLVVRAQPKDAADEAIEKAKDADETAYTIDLSVSMFVVVKDANGTCKNSATAKVAELPRDIEVSITVDPATIKGKNVRIARNHDGKIDFITPTKVDESTGAITFLTDRFSTYAVLTSEKAPAAKVYEVTFVDKFNNVTNVADVEAGKVVPKPNDPTFEGYKFVGWFTDEDATNEYDFTKEVNSSFTLYAGYQKIEAADNGATGDKGNGKNDTEKTEKAAEQPAALVQTGDSMAIFAVGALALSALIVAGAVILRRRNQQ